jgi:hypothetical protein
MKMRIFFLPFGVAIASFSSRFMMIFADWQPSTPLTASAYYFPDQVRIKLCRDFATDRVDNAELHRMAVSEGLTIDRQTFYSSLDAWKIKQLLKRVLGVKSPLGDQKICELTPEDFVRMHYEENVEVIREHGYAEEMLQEMYLAFKLLQHWAASAAWRLSRYLFCLMHSHTHVFMGALKAEDMVIYEMERIRINLTSEADYKSYISCFPKLIENLPKARELEDKSELFNPFGFNPSQHECVYKNILALEQFRRLHDARLRHFHKRFHSSLEGVILSTTPKAHFQILSPKLTTPQFRKIIRGHLLKTFMWRQPPHEDVILFSASPDMKLKRRVMVQEYQAAFGLPGPLRAYMLLLLQENIDRHYVNYVEVEFQLGSHQREVLRALSQDEPLFVEEFDLQVKDSTLKSACQAWIRYWTLLITKVGQVNHQTASSPFLHTSIHEYFLLNAVPHRVPRETFLESIELAVLCDGTFLVGFSKLLHQSDVGLVLLLMRHFEEYQRALIAYFEKEGLHVEAFKANKIQVDVVKYDIFN